MKLTSGGFAILRTGLFSNSLTQSQVDSLNFLVAHCEDAGLTYPETAYALATVFHETGVIRNGKLVRTLEPIKEFGSDAYLKSKKYYPFIGYGYVQLTWEANYKRVGDLIGVNLIKNPARALEPEVAVKIMTQGMLHGWFTGVGFRRKRPVSRYNKAQYIAARAIINGSDKAVLIAGYAMIIEQALRSN